MVRSFDPQRKMYKKIPIEGQHEVIGMSGDIALYQGKPVVHTHGTTCCYFTDGINQRHCKANCDWMRLNTHD
jgi:hypothetical protein